MTGPREDVKANPSSSTQSSFAELRPYIHRQTSSKLTIHEKKKARIGQKEASDFFQKMFQQADIRKYIDTFVLKLHLRFIPPCCLIQAFVVISVHFDENSHMRRGLSVSLSPELIFYESNISILRFLSTCGAL